MALNTDAVSAAQAARSLGISAVTLKSIRNRREIGSVKVGKRWKYLPEHISAYLERNTQTPHNDQ